MWAELKQSLFSTRYQYWETEPTFVWAELMQPLFSTGYQRWETHSLTHGKWQVRNVTGEQITGLPSPHSPFSYVIPSCTICSEAPTGRLDTQCGTSSISTPVTKLRQRKTRLPAAGDPDLLSLDISTSAGAAHNTAWLILVINGYWAWKCTFLPLCLFIYQKHTGLF